MFSTTIRHRDASAGLAAAALLASVAFGATASAATVARPGTSTEIREYQGTIVFSQYDQAAKSWSLNVRSGGGPVRRLNVSPSPTPFDADIGPDRLGRPQLVYQRCAGFAERRTDTFIYRAPRGCDLFVYSLAGAGAERPVRNANDPDNDDVSPTLWRGRIAWTRLYKSGPVVYTKLLVAPRERPSTRLPGVPERRCGDVDPGCVTTEDRNVASLELRADRLALIVTYTCRTCAGVAQSELRLDELGASSRTVARLVVGLNGQRLVGPSLSSDRIGWYYACTTSEVSCRSRVGPYRYGLTTKRYERASGPILVTGFADAGSKLYEGIECGAPESAEVPGALTPTCRIDEIADPAYASVRPLLR